MESALFRKYSGNVPRYTSYPTALQFRPGIGADFAEKWLSALPPRQPVSLYFHVPFCHQLCWYCACHTRVANRYGPVSAYLTLLEKEIALVSSHLGFRPRVSHFHWGGGSPNMVRGKDFRKLMEFVHARFDLAGDAEVAMEADPRTLTRERTRAFAGAGINRVSLGVQDFNPHVQLAINRVQPFEMVRNVVGLLRDAGIKKINFDLMYGLPGQRLEDVVRNVDLAVQLAPDRLAVFGYAHVPWLKPHQKMIPEESLAGPELRLEMAETIASQLKALGYARIGLDHFARPGDPMAKAARTGQLRRNFQGYTTDQATTLIGFGASAIGKFPPGFVQTAPDLRKYAASIAAGRLAIVRGVETTPRDRLRWDIIERLMCEMKVDLAAVCNAHQIRTNYFAPELTTLRDLASDRLVSVKGTRIKIPEQARPLARVVCSVFDRYLDRDERRHSPAV